ncbi:MAG: hypothetical protein QOI17_286 [Gaiellales bacterium]|nr:hypothetical protein [Gaiellales bacterium]
MAARAACLLLLAGLAGGCGSSGGSAITVPSVASAHVYTLGSFTPSGPVKAGTPVTVSFDIRQPSGAPLTQFATGPGPHTGVHLIIVRKDLSVIIHRHPPIAASGHLSESVTFPAPGPYLVLVDVYAKATGPVPFTNYQMRQMIQVTGGAYHAKPIGPVRDSATAGGWTFTMRHVPRLRVAQAALITVDVRNAAGRPARFSSWFGALAHAVFFHQGNLQYFHTHICAPHSAGCSGVGAISGNSTKPGVLNVGVLLPTPGTWRLFLQTRISGVIVTAPFTLKVAP